MKLSLPQKVIQKRIAVKIRTIELLSALDMLSLVILVIMQTLKAMQMAMQNRLLEQKAFMMPILDCLIKMPVMSYLIKKI